ncbi:hypothetical protein ANN_13865 [Periplaneta americana]|uniref:Uncharacterized protein n=1 Tax=Periplaneta americana TaxID=6978 RepID=A0ABQ8SW28_PERAM|nr:hypothetical protein ANN_13865 [Periplaneta americana]
MYSSRLKRESNLLQSATTDKNSQSYLFCQASVKVIYIRVSQEPKPGKQHVRKVSTLIPVLVRIPQMAVYSDATRGGDVFEIEPISNDAVIWQYILLDDVSDEEQLSRSEQKWLKHKSLTECPSMDR